MRPSRLILVNGVYGAPEHFDALRAALAPDCATEVFTFRRLGEPDPLPGRGFAPMVRRLDGLVRSAAPGRAADTPIDADQPPPAAPAPRPALFGFSLGGALALEYVLQHPDRVAALILVNAFDRYHPGGLQPGLLPAMWRVPVARWSPGFMSRFVHGLPWLRRAFFHRTATLDDVARGMLTATAIADEDVRFQLAHLGLPLPPGQAERLARVAERVPVLLASSRDDLVVPPFHTDRLAAAMPAARRLPPFEGGHAFFQHDGEALAQAVRGFLAEARGRDRPPTAETI